MVTRTANTFSISELHSSEVHWLSPADDALWDAFVASHPLGLVYHLSEWRRVVEDAFPHIKGHFLALGEAGTGRILAGVPVYTVRSWLLGNRTVSIPFASFCDPLISCPQDFSLLMSEICAFSQRTGNRKIEIRTRKTSRQCAMSSLSPSVNFKHHYLPLNTSTDALYASFAKSSVCQKISHAHRSGVVVEEGIDDNDLQICHSILVDTRRRHSLPPIPFAFFRSMKQSLGPQRIKIFLARHQGKPVACHLVLLFKDLWISEYSGNTELAVAGVNQLLYWETIRQAHAHCARNFSFGRTAVSNDGLLQYKRRWATTEEDLTFFDDSAPMSKPGAAGGTPAIPRQHALASWLIGRTPMPFYRWMGDFCYRHLG
jgi:Acetyltransferase (GNAT) domain